jgi:hypothetical protein
MAAMDNKILFLDLVMKKIFELSKAFTNFILFTQLIAAVVPLAAYKI